MKLFDFAIIIALSSAFTLNGGAEFYFEKTKHKFPDTTEGTVLNYDFHFTNKGSQPLVITDYKVACSCTQIEFPKEPVLPEQKGVIKMRFDSTGKYGLQNRKIELISNAGQNPFVLSFKVYIIPKD